MGMPRSLMGGTLPYSTRRGRLTMYSRSLRRARAPGRRTGRTTGRSTGTNQERGGGPSVSAHPRPSGPRCPRPCRPSRICPFPVRCGAFLPRMSVARASPPSPSGSAPPLRPDPPLRSTDGLIQAVLEEADRRALERLSVPPDAEPTLDQAFGWRCRLIECVVRVRECQGVGEAGGGCVLRSWWAGRRCRWGGPRWRSG